MSKVLCTVGVLALIFTTVNVTRFATSRGVPGPIAILLDPMIGMALAGVLYADARLASWGIRPPGWSTTLRWTSGCTAALMNTWQSLWPDRRIGWPHHADPAAVLLHLTPALLLITLTETIAAYRTTINNLLGTSTTIGSPAGRPRSVSRPAKPAHADPNPADPNPAKQSTPGGRSDTRATAGAPIGQPTEAPATDAEMWLRATALNDSALAATGDPVSVWRLRTDLRIGPRRARQIRNRLLTDRPIPP
ncbi:extensin [Actinacidiphila yeochonensis]|uniref:extensin n=1 Tax=Actinacidiphila yeochonensis TaxID=89050 RepID=UPI000D1B7923|nr:extensin [Actinacidiphila yeochonensis]